MVAQEIFFVQHLNTILSKVNFQESVSILPVTSVKKILPLAGVVNIMLRLRIRIRAITYGSGNCQVFFILNRFELSPVAQVSYQLSTLVSSSL